MANPRYPENESVNLKKYLAQFVSKITFTAVNIDKYLPDGSVKADPLVKRVVGLPGEKLMMVDDVLYHKRSGDQSFTAVGEDKTWARVDLWKEDPDIVSRIIEVKIDSKQRDTLGAWDSKRREADPGRLAASIAVSAKEALRPLPAAAIERFTAEFSKQRPDLYAVLIADRDAFLKADPSAGNPIAAAGPRADDLALILALASPGSGAAALRASLSDYAAGAAVGAAAQSADPYARGGRAVNLLIKDNLLARLAREASLIGSGASFSAMASDAEFKRLTKEGSELEFYVNGPDGGGLYDARNFPPFPSGDAYLGPKQYFAMGDNRYNSLDFRYRTGGYSLKSLDPADPASVQYYSNVDPFALDLRFIEGYALFRIWPPSRAGAIR
jgi:signal peptidase I